jgi:hypothetical protein
MSAATSRARQGPGPRRDPHGPHAVGRVTGRSQRHLARPADREGDVLAVDEDVEERLAGPGEGSQAVRADERAQVGDDLGGGQFRLPHRRVVDHPVPVPTGAEHFAYDLPGGEPGRECQMGGHASHPPVPAPGASHTPRISDPPTGRRGSPVDATAALSPTVQGVRSAPGATADPRRMPGTPGDPACVARTCLRGSALPRPVIRPPSSARPSPKGTGRCRPSNS